jgi:CheY-like chemotaxis protein
MAKILVIEDDEFILELLSEVLGYEGYAVVCARTGESGLELAGAEKPDVVLCDVFMGGMDGHAVLKAMREAPATREIPVIFLSGQATPEEIEAGFAEGVNGYLSKPATRDEILASISGLLEKPPVSGE